MEKEYLQDAYTIHSLSGVELWREYDFGDRVYRINDPVTLVVRKGGTTHRVVDKKGIVHCLPAPGVSGCVVRWEAIDSKSPVAF